MKQKTVFLTEIESQVEKAMDKALYVVAEKIGLEVDKIYESVIEEFYASYKPHRYKRTGATFYGSRLDPELPEQTDTGYITGLEISPDNIPGTPYRANKDWVFERTFVKGYHGYKRDEVKAWRKKRGLFYTRYGVNTKEKLRQKEIGAKYFFKRENGMQPLKPTPQVRFERKLRKKFQQKNKEFDQVFTDEFVKNFIRSRSKYPQTLNLFLKFGIDIY